MSEQHHARLLLAIVRERWDEARALARQSPVRAEPFVDLCRQADVATWVHARLESTGRGELIGDRAMEELGRFRAKVRRDNLLLIARAEQSLGILLDAGIMPVALKGLDLLYRLYADHDLRTLDDVDLLVRPEQLHPAVAALEAAGWEAPPEPQRTHYIRSSHHLPMRSPGPIRVEFEIHWNLAQEMRYTIDQAAIHDRAVPIDIGGRQVRRMEDHDLVAHLDPLLGRDGGERRLVAPPGPDRAGVDPGNRAPRSTRGGLAAGPGLAAALDPSDRPLPGHPAALGPALPRRRDARESPADATLARPPRHPGPAGERPPAGRRAPW